MKYKRNYIGLQRDGVPNNFSAFRPRKKHLIWEARIERSEEVDARIEEAGITVIPYGKRWKNYRFQLVRADLKTHSDLVTDIRMSRGLPTAQVDETVGSSAI